jgi:hypothetical protein
MTRVRQWFRSVESDFGTLAFELMLVKDLRREDVRALGRVFGDSGIDSWSWIAKSYRWANYLFQGPDRRKLGDP